MSITFTAEQKAAMNAPYDTPERFRGDMIVFFPTGKRDYRTQFGFVYKLGPRFTDIQLSDGQIISAVAHIDDPKLRNPVIREKGAWDHTESSKRRGDVVKRIQNIESALLALVPPDRKIMLQRLAEMDAPYHVTMPDWKLKKLLRNAYLEKFGDISGHLHEASFVELEEDDDEIVDSDA